MLAAELTEINDIKCIKLQSGKYVAHIAYEIGSNVIRFQDIEEKIEFFRFKPDETSEIVSSCPQVYGLPTLYLPNRFGDGILKTSDATYNLPINEPSPFNNHLHGFLHLRPFKIIEHKTENDQAIAVTQYTYDSNDEFYKHLPIDFIAELKFIDGLHYQLKLTNTSKVQMPISVCTHTCMYAPIVEGGSQASTRLKISIGKRCILSSRFLPTKEFKDLDKYDKLYKDGNQCPVLQDIDNDLFTAEQIDVDGKKFNGFIVEDKDKGKKIVYEVDDKFKFWMIWNDKGDKNYFCPEPMTAIVDAPNLGLENSITGYSETKPGETYELHQHIYTLN